MALKPGSQLNIYMNNMIKFKPELSRALSTDKKGDEIGLFITLVPKVLYNVFIFVGLATVGTYIEG